MKDDVYSEVRIDYLNEETKQWSVDAWKGDNDEGESVATIDNGTFAIAYKNDECYHSREFWLAVADFIKWHIGEQRWAEQEAADFKEISLFDCCSL